ncbi:MAG TPA: hypothetical protein VF789_19005 [Thermoanaerobaculia bacterium]
MRKLFALTVILLGTVLLTPRVGLSSDEECPTPTAGSCVEVDSYVEICSGGLGARICTVYNCSNGASHTCCTECEGPN